MNAVASPQSFEYGWNYIDNTSQELALGVTAHHILYHGTRGPGKTDTQLMRFKRNVGVGYGPFWRGVIFDREYKNLDDLVTKSKRWYYDYNDGAVFLESTAQFKWKWPTGEELLFRSVKVADDYWSYHGHEYPFLGWNELTKYESAKLYEKMMSVNRSSFIPKLHTLKVEPQTLRFYQKKFENIREVKVGDYATETGLPCPPIPLEVFSTCNPYGAGHSWVKRRFIDPIPDKEILRVKSIVFDPLRKKEVEVEKKQIAIKGNWRENPFLSPDYIAELTALTDENEREAWLNGNWDINAGGALADLWRKDIHIIPRFAIPAGWQVDRALDWGSTHPFSVGWFAVANGEEVVFEYKGDTYNFCPPAGTIIQIAEWYGTKEIGTNVGLKYGAKRIAEGIRDIEVLLLEQGWIQEQPAPGPADNQIRNVTDSEIETIEKRMGSVGIRWTDSDKSPGSRKNGLQLIRDRLEASRLNEGAGLLFMDNCRASIAILPGLPRDEKNPDDVDTKTEDHCYDMVRYRVLASSDRMANVIRVNF